MFLLLESNGSGRKVPEDVVVHTYLRVNKPPVEQWVASLGAGIVEEVRCCGPLGANGHNRCYTRGGGELGEPHGALVVI
jgi:hypothetical protein